MARFYDQPNENSGLLYQEWLEDDAYVNMAENICLGGFKYGGSGEIEVSCDCGRDNGYGDTVRSYIALFPILSGAVDTADTTGHQQGGDTVGVASAAEPQVRLNTDPAGGWVEIGVAGGTVFDAAVYDVCGKVAARPCTASGSVRIDTSRWPAGVYVARVRTAAGVMSCKFVVARR
ncbi:MAG: T9SS type A sorting domain-containing protein [Bacteroidales bacterium]|nr:T9SS type A sorting domain-containing protein [Bacteroidales bacterium]